MRVVFSESDDPAAKGTTQRSETGAPGHRPPRLAVPNLKDALPPTGSRVGGDHLLAAAAPPATESGFVCVP